MYEKCVFGTIILNKYLMGNYSEKKKNNVLLHELGHALGLGHNKKGDVMYKKVSKVVKLSDNDKASLNSAMKKW